MWGVRHNIKTEITFKMLQKKILEFQFYTVKSLLPAPEDRHYIADDLVLFIHSQVSWLGSLW